MVKALGLSVVLLLTPNFNASAQDLPPIPGGGGTKPREQTPEELEAQRKAEEAQWRRNRERFAPWLHESDAAKETLAAEADWLWRFQLLSAVEGESAKEQVRQAHAEELARAAGIPLRKDGHRDGKDVLLVGDRVEIVKALGLNAAKSIKADKLWPGGGTNLSLTGSGITVGMWDLTQVRTTHVEFAGVGIPRVINVDSGMASPSNHSTAVAGAIISAGVSNVNAIGTAYESHLRVHDLSSDYTEVTTEANGTFAVKMTSHTYGLLSGWETISSSTFYWNGRNNEYEDYKYGLYSDRAKEFDKTVFESGYVLPVWSAGNERSLYGPPSHITNHFHGDGGSTVFTDLHLRSNSWDTLQVHSSAKNILTVGSVQPLVNGYQGATSVISSYFSSWGPSDDGRIKPDLVANGETVVSTAETGDTAYNTFSGTSMAAPSVAGALALIYERYYQTHRAAKKMRASTLKALAIHTADEAGDAAGPDFKFGWGLFNALAMVQLLDANATNLSAGAATADPHIREVQKYNEGPANLYVYPKGTEPVKITVVWSDPAGTNDTPFVVDSANKRLVNDINVRAYNGSGTWFPWVLDGANPANAATTNINHIDNVEQIVIASPSTNLLTIELGHTGSIRDAAVNGNLTNQWVSVVITGIKTIPKPQPIIVDFDQVGATNLALLFTALPGLGYRIQYIDEVTSANWQDEGAPYTATTTNVAATVTYTNANAQRFYRVITDN